MRKKKITRVSYHVEISCEVNKYGAVIPDGANYSIINHETGEHVGMNKYPGAEKIMQMWIGKYLSYPKIGEEI